MRPSFSRPESHFRPFDIVNLSGDGGKGLDGFRLETQRAIPTRLSFFTSRETPCAAETLLKLAGIGLARRLASARNGADEQARPRPRSRPGDHRRHSAAGKSFGNRLSQPNIPHLAGDLVQQSIFYPYTWNEGTASHFNTIGSILTGVWQHVDDWGRDHRPVPPTPPVRAEAVESRAFGDVGGDEQQGAHRQHRRRYKMSSSPNSCWLNLSSASSWVAIRATNWTVTCCSRNSRRSCRTTTSVSAGAYLHHRPSWTPN